MFKAIKFVLPLTMILCINEVQTFAQSVTCIRKVAPVNKAGRVQLGKIINVRQGQCNGNEVQVSNELSASDLLALVNSVSGSGSGLNADLLDGLDSSHFADATSLQSVASIANNNQQNISQLQSSVGTNTTNIANLSGNLTNVTGDVSALQGSLTNANTNITNNQNSISDLDTGLNNLSGNVSTLGTSVTNLGLGPRIVRVALSGAQFSSLASAVAFAQTQTPTANSPIQILVGPGQYSVNANLTIPAHVEVKGSGKHLTSIILSSSTVSITMGSHTRLSNLSVKGLFGGTAVGVGSVSPVSGNGFDPTSYAVSLRDVWIEVDGNPMGGQNRGILDSDNTGIMLERSEITVKGGSTLNYCIGQFGTPTSDILLKESYCYTEGTGEPIGIQWASSGRLSILNSTFETVSGTALQVAGAGTISVYGSTINSGIVGINALGTTTTRIRNSVITVSTNAIRALLGTPTLVISNSTLASTTPVNAIMGATITCAFISNASGAAFLNTCS